MKHYPVIDLPIKYRRNFLNNPTPSPYDVVGITTGEFRPPKKGEFYLSGAIPKVYEAKENFTSSYNICILKRKQKIESYYLLPLEDKENG